MACDRQWLALGLGNKGASGDGMGEPSGCSIGWIGGTGELRHDELDRRCEERHGRAAAQVGSGERRQDGRDRRRGGRRHCRDRISSIGAAKGGISGAEEQRQD